MGSSKLTCSRPTYPTCFASSLRWLAYHLPLLLSLVYLHAQKSSIMLTALPLLVLAVSSASAYSSKPAHRKLKGPGYVQMPVQPCGTYSCGVCDLYGLIRAQSARSQ